jgi:hypothetical protein
MSIVKRLPRRVTGRVQDTPLESMYWWYRVKTTSLDNTQVTTPVGEFSVLIPEGNEWFLEKYTEQEYEPSYFTALAAEIDGSPNEVYFDIGSRWGICISAAKAMGLSEDHIHGFEANPISYRALEENHGDSDVHLNRVRVGETMMDEEVAIDDYTESHSDPSIVKLDVEGAELSVLRGMKVTIKRCTPILFIEVHPGLLRQFGHQQSQVLDLLKSHGYRLTKAEDHREDSNWSTFSRESLPEDGDYMIKAEVSNHT